MASNRNILKSFGIGSYNFVDPRFCLYDKRLALIEMLKDRAQKNNIDPGVIEFFNNLRSDLSKQSTDQYHWFIQKEGNEEFIGLVYLFIIRGTCHLLIYRNTYLVEFRRALHCLIFKIFELLDCESIISYPMLPTSKLEKMNKIKKSKLEIGNIHSFKDYSVVEAVLHRKDWKFNSPEDVLNYNFVDDEDLIKLARGEDIEEN